MDKIGNIMKKFAFDLHREYGDNFLFQGEIIEIEKKKDEYDIEEVTGIQIEFEIPVIKANRNAN
ncbi:MAG: hypothetical protein PHR96_04050 [Clostridia bacterium]|nr:hypothetical protein [Clostridia bacterium]